MASFDKIELILDNLMHREAEPEDALLAASGYPSIKKDIAAGIEALLATPHLGVPTPPRSSPVKGEGVARPF